MTAPRKHKAVVKLSRVDQERLERGEISNPTEALHLNDRRVTESEPAAVEPSVRPRDANEQRLLADRPPHFGKL